MACIHWYSGPERRARHTRAALWSGRLSLLPALVPRHRDDAEKRKLGSRTERVSCWRFRLRAWILSWRFVIGGSVDLIRDTSHLIGKEVCSFSYSKEKFSCGKKWELSDVVGLRSSNPITRPWRMVLRGGAVATLSRASTRWAVVQFDCHPEASVLCAAKDLGEPREASRSLRRNNRAFGSLPYQTAPPPSCTPVPIAPFLLKYLLVSCRTLQGDTRIL